MDNALGEDISFSETGGTLRPDKCNQAFKEIAYPQRYGNLG
jgi:hypothetical protein